MTIQRPYRVYLIDDEVIVRAWLKERIDEADDLECIGEARNGVHARAFLESYEGDIDLVVLDLAMPERDGFATLDDLHRLQPRARVLIYTQHRDPEYVRRCKKNAHGYMLKDEPVSGIMPVLRGLIRGKAYFSPGVAVARDASRNDQVVTDFRLKLTKLTPSEREVVLCAARGMTSRDAGKYLNKSHRTVEEQLRKIYKKLDVNNKAELAQFAVRSDLIQ
ncbi:MAG: response regulator transcription factor [Leptospirales bacterium]|jgi:two-component system invasion response regulator UvrY